MQAVEGLTRLITLGDLYTKVREELANPTPEEQAEREQDQLAISICQAMLNTALPVAKYRVFVKIESGREKGREYTICAVSIEDIVAALYPLTQMIRSVYVTLWEQRATGADMLEGFQGPTRDRKGRFRSYLDMLKKYRVLAN